MSEVEKRWLPLLANFAAIPPIPDQNGSVIIALDVYFVGVMISTELFQLLDERGIVFDDVAQVGFRNI